MVSIPNTQQLLNRGTMMAIIGQWYQQKSKYTDKISSLQLFIVKKESGRKLDERKLFWEDNMEG